MSQSVLKDWVVELPLMMQGTIITSIRGNDLAHAPKLKPVTRWLRSLILNNGNPENDFMDVPKLPAVEEFEDELEYLTIHYFAHLLHTLEIVGYRHPEDKVAEIALNYYARLVDWLHLEPEAQADLESRLSGQPGTTGSKRKWFPLFAKNVIQMRELERSGEQELVALAQKTLRERGYDVYGPEHIYRGRTGS